MSTAKSRSSSVVAHEESLKFIGQRRSVVKRSGKDQGSSDE